MDARTTTLDGNSRQSEATSADASPTLDQLHESTRDLIRARTREEIAEIVVDAAHQILGFTGTGIRFYDPESDALVNASFDGDPADEVEARPDFDVDDSPHGDAFRSGQTVAYDVPEDGGPYGLDPFERTMYVPIGDHGVLSLGRADPGSFDRVDVQYAEILAANTRASLDRIEREARLREQRRELERKNERLQQFASVVSHDMRGPINAAQGYLEFARDDGDEEFFRRIDDALDRLARFTTDLLTLARRTAEVGDPAEVDLASVAGDAWRSVDTKRATLTRPEDATVEADPESLQRLFENLFRNAVMHAGPDVAVTVGTVDGGFYVADDGPGIPERERDSVFEEGYSTSSDGTGLGLTIVESLAGAHGWDVSLAVGDDGGARFEITGVERV
ncbi:sensor histidine kinase [Halorussus halobius]|uniref:sensor histidine kinase n=1 Tax=Halorussus halobius TaxID=1710537 RepID=UPI001092205A|nr:GAF domain-containing sensor histidine kinase [Halorussus halobius]